MHTFDQQEKRFHDLATATREQSGGGDSREKGTAGLRNDRAFEHDFRQSVEIAVAAPTALDVQPEIAERKRIAAVEGGDIDKVPR